MTYKVYIYIYYIYIYIYIYIFIYKFTFSIVACVLNHQENEFDSASQMINDWTNSIPNKICVTTTLR